MRWTRKKKRTTLPAPMSLSPERGEIWQVDFGITQKVRPALVISVGYEDSDRALIGIIPHTRAIRGSQWEVVVLTRFLSEGAFLVQGIQALAPRYFCAGWVCLRRHKWEKSLRFSCAGRASAALDRSLQAIA